MPLSDQLMMPTAQSSSGLIFSPVPLVDVTAPSTRLPPLFFSVIVTATLPSPFLITTLLAQKSSILTGQHLMQSRGLHDPSSVFHESILGLYGRFRAITVPWRTMHACSALREPLLP